MIYFKGDEVRTNDGKVGEIIEVSGVARTWHKIRTTEGGFIYAMTEHIDSLVRRHSNKRGRAAK